MALLTGNSNSFTEIASVTATFGRVKSAEIFKSIAYNIPIGKVRSAVVVKNPNPIDSFSFDPNKISQFKVIGPTNPTPSINLANVAKLRAAQVLKNPSPNDALLFDPKKIGQFKVIGPTNPTPNINLANVAKLKAAQVLKASVPREDIYYDPYTIRQFKNINNQIFATPADTYLNIFDSQYWFSPENSTRAIVGQAWPKQTLSGSTISVNLGSPTTTITFQFPTGLDVNKPKPKAGDYLLLTDSANKQSIAKTLSLTDNGGVTFTVQFGQVLFASGIATGTGGSGVLSSGAQYQHTWTCPANVYNVSVVCVGAGSGSVYPGGGGGALAWANNIAVVPGQVYTVYTGVGGAAGVGGTGGNSSFNVGGTSLLATGGIYNGAGGTFSNTIPNVSSTGGGNGGAAGAQNGTGGSAGGGGGGGAGGYNGAGGAGGSNSAGGSPVANSGAGAGGFGNVLGSSPNSGQGGGGVGLLGIGSTGVPNGGGGSGGSTGAGPAPGNGSSNGGVYGAGAGGGSFSTGADGAVRIIWPATRVANGAILRAFGATAGATVLATDSSSTITESLTVFTATIATADIANIIGTNNWTVQPWDPEVIPQANVRTINPPTNPRENLYYASLVNTKYGTFIPFKPDARTDSIDLSTGLIRQSKYQNFVTLNSPLALSDKLAAFDSSTWYTNNNPNLILVGSANTKNNNNNVISTMTSNTRTASGSNSLITVTSNAYYGSFTSQYLTIASNAAFSFAAGDFTVEAWVYTSAPPGGGVTNDKLVFGGFSASIPAFVCFLQNTDNAPAIWNGTTQYNSSIVVPTNTWTHVAWVRNNSTLSIYVNGVVGLTQRAYTTSFATSNTWYIGRNDTAADRFFPGFISNLRVVKGTAVYTGNFTPSSTLSRIQPARNNVSALAGTETSLLTLQSPTVIDNSINALTISNPVSVTTTLNSIYSVLFANPLANEYVLLTDAITNNQALAPISAVTIPSTSSYVLTIANSYVTNLNNSNPWYVQLWDPEVIPQSKVITTLAATNPREILYYVNLIRGNRNGVYFPGKNEAISPINNISLNKVDNTILQSTVSTTLAPTNPRERLYYANLVKGKYGFTIPTFNPADIPGADYKFDINNITSTILQSSIRTTLAPTNARERLYYATLAQGRYGLKYPYEQPASLADNVLVGKMRSVNVLKNPSPNDAIYYDAFNLQKQIQVLKSPMQVPTNYRLSDFNAPYTYFNNTNKVAVGTYSSRLYNFSTISSKTTVGSNTALTVTNPSSGISFITNSQTYYGVFNGTTQYLTAVTPPTPGTIITGPFTIEAWVFPTTLANIPFVVENTYWNTGNNGGWYLAIGVAGALNLGYSTATVSAYSALVSTGAISINVWSHIAVVRDINNFVSFYINGQLANSPTLLSQSLNLDSGGSQLNYNTRIGAHIADGLFSNGFTGNISNVRIVPNRAVYTGPFTPLGPLSRTQISRQNVLALGGTETSLLALTTSTVTTDSSINNATITNVGAIAAPTLSQALGTVPRVSDYVLITDTVTNKQSLGQITAVTSNASPSITITIPSASISNLDSSNTWAYSLWDPEVFPQSNVLTNLAPANARERLYYASLVRGRYGLPFPFESPATVASNINTERMGDFGIGDLRSPINNNIVIAGQTNTKYTGSGTTTSIVTSSGSTTISFNKPAGFPSVPVVGEYLLLTDSNGSQALAPITDSNSPAVGAFTVTSGQALYTTSTIDGSYSSANNAYTFSWQAPPNVYRVAVAAVGGGGGGAYTNANNTTTGGGAGGALAYTNNISVTPGQFYTVQVGAGGSGVVTVGSTENGGAGGTSYFKDSATISANGGLGGVVTTSTTVILPQSQSLYSSPGSYTWTAPTDVYSIAVVCVGGGGGGGQFASRGGGGGALAWANRISVVPGTGYTIVVGGGGGTAASGGASSATFGSVVITANGGNGSSVSSGTGGTYSVTGVTVGDYGGGNGGNGGANATNQQSGGGGGAGGYGGNGGNGGAGIHNTTGGSAGISGGSGSGGAGGGGGGSGTYGTAIGGGGGGVGVLGVGANGAGGAGGPGNGGAGGTGKGGSSGNNAGQPAGGAYGGGAGGGTTSSAVGAGGAVRIIWPSAQIQDNTLIRGFGSSSGLLATDQTGTYSYPVLGVAATTAAGGTYIGNGGGNGGNGGSISEFLVANGKAVSGGGGAGGYTGAGGSGGGAWGSGSSAVTAGLATAGSGGGGGGGGAAGDGTIVTSAGAGGGVDISSGSGSSGSAGAVATAVNVPTGGDGGSSGTAGGNGSTTVSTAVSVGGLYGGGGGGVVNSATGSIGAGAGSPGAVRIIWPANKLIDNSVVRAFPSTSVLSQSTVISDNTGAIPSYIITVPTSYVSNLSTSGTWSVQVYEDNIIKQANVITNLSPANARERLYYASLAKGRYGLRYPYESPATLPDSLTLDNLRLYKTPNNGFITTRVDDTTPLAIINQNDWYSPANSKDAIAGSASTRQTITGQTLGINVGETTSTISFKSNSVWNYSPRANDYVLLTNDRTGVQSIAKILTISNNAGFNLVVSLGQALMAGDGTYTGTGVAITGSAANTYQYSWTCPENIFSVSAIAVGAGGGGAGYAQPGGGGGALAWGNGISVVPGQTYNITVGTGPAFTTGITSTVTFGSVTLTAAGGNPSGGGGGAYSVTGTAGTSIQSGGGNGGNGGGNSGAAAGGGGGAGGYGGSGGDGGLGIYNTTFGSGGAGGGAGTGGGGGGGGGSGTYGSGTGGGGGGVGVLGVGSNGVGGSGGPANGGPGGGGGGSGGTGFSVPTGGVYGGGGGGNGGSGGAGAVRIIWPALRIGDGSTVRAFGNGTNIANALSTDQSSSINESLLIFTATVATSEIQNIIDAPSCTIQPWDPSYIPQALVTTPFPPTNPRERLYWTNLTSKYSSLTGVDANKDTTEVVYDRDTKGIVVKFRTAALGQGVQDPAYKPTAPIQFWN